MVHSAALAEDQEAIFTDQEWPEIDLGNILDKVKVTVIDDDKFRKFSYSGLPAKYKRRWTTKKNDLQKKHESDDGEAAAKYKDPEAVDGYGMFDLVEPPYNLEALSQLYDEHAIHRACVDARVMNTVALGHNWKQSSKSRQKTEDLSDDTDKADKWRRKIQRERDRLEEILDSWNVEDAFHDILIKAFTDALTIGNGYIEIGRRKNGEIGYVGHIPGKLIRIRKDRDGFVQQAGRKAIFFRNFGDDAPDPLNDDPQPNEVIHIKIYSPTNNYYGVPPAVGATAAILGDNNAKEYNLDFFENKAVPRYAVILKGFKLNEKSKRDLLNFFRNELKGRHHGTLVIPVPPALAATKDADIKFEQLEVGVQDSSFEKYRKANRDEIISAYRVPPTKVSVFDNANLAVSRDADRTFKTQVVGPDQVSITKKINLIISEFTDLIEFEFEQLDVIDEDLQSRIYDRYLRARVMNPNEVREELGRTAFEGGDRFLVHAPEVKLVAERFLNVEGDPITPPPLEVPQAPGAPQANDNASSGRSQQDSPSQPSTDARDTGQRERGQAQDENRVRERTQA